MTDTASPFTVIHGSSIDPYQEKVVFTYSDDPQDWKKIIGERLLFNWGIYNHPDSPRPVSLDEAGLRYLERQLELAGLPRPARTPAMPSPRRILDVGCGWGFILGHLASLYPECPRLDGINVTRRQLEHCHTYLSGMGLSDRVNLYLCNAGDVALLPDPDLTYDLVIMSGVATHFTNDLYEEFISALASRMSPGGTVVISDTLYKDLSTYQSAIPDLIDRQASGYRKDPDYFTKVLIDSGFVISAMQVLPSNSDVAHWLLEVLSNIETHYPAGATGSFKELSVTAVNLSIGLLLDKISVYSIIATYNGR